MRIYLIDSLVSCRTEEKNNSSGSDDRVLSTFLIEMDGINNNIFNVKNKKKKRFCLKHCFQSEYL